MAGAQLIGKDSVLKAYEQADIDTWAIFQVKRPIMSGQGIDELNKWLDILIPANSSVTYYLRLYRDAAANEDISANTPYTCNWDFKLHNDYHYGYSGMGGVNGEVMARLEKIEKSISENKPDEDELSMNKIFMGWLKDPVQLGQVIGAVRMLIGGGGDAMPAMMSGLPTTPQRVAEKKQSMEVTPVQPANAQTEEQIQKRWDEVLDNLEAKCPEILDHLEKLSRMADKNPAQFQFLIVTLKGMQV